ncbi:hypothetical protein GCM10023083_33010 [Streptomyces phyllanthi]
MWLMTVSWNGGGEAAAEAGLRGSRWALRGAVGLWALREGGECRGDTERGETLAAESCLRRRLQRRGAHSGDALAVNATALRGLFNKAVAFHNRHRAMGRQETGARLFVVVRRRVTGTGG